MTKTLVWVGIAAAVLLSLKLLALFLEPRLAFHPVRGVTGTPESAGLDARHVEVGTADGERLDAWWLPHPAPRAEVLFWHGNGGNLSLWLDVLVRLRRHGFSVFAVDYRGYGASTGSPTEAGLYRDTDAFLRAFRDRLHEPTRPVIYWGRSLGGAAAAYATTVVAPDALVLESPFAEGLAVVREDPVLAVLSPFASYRFPTARFLRGWRGPTLVLHGDRDRVVPSRHGRELFEGLAGEKRFVTVPGADHEDLDTREPDLYWDAVDELVEQIRRP